jgi:hypothetical protein
MSYSKKINDSKINDRKINDRQINDRKINDRKIKSDPNKDLYGFYYDIETNHLLNEDDCVVFLPNTNNTRITTTPNAVSIIKKSLKIKQLQHAISQNFMRITFCIFMIIILL